MVAVAYPELPTTGMPKVFTKAVFNQSLARHSPSHQWLSPTKNLRTAEITVESAKIGWFGGWQNDVTPVCS
jgi:hypothetical protein